MLVKTYVILLRLKKKIHFLHKRRWWKCTHSWMLPSKIWTTLYVESMCHGTSSYRTCCYRDKLQTEKMSNGKGCKSEQKPNTAGRLMKWLERADTGQPPLPCHSLWRKKKAHVGNKRLSLIPTSKLCISPPNPPFPASQTQLRARPFAKSGLLITGPHLEFPQRRV